MHVVLHSFLPWHDRLSQFLVFLSVQLAVLVSTKMEFDYSHDTCCKCHNKEHLFTENKTYIVQCLKILLSLF